VHVVSHAVEPRPAPKPFGERSGILFVGAFHELSPNGDAVRWFVANVLPAIRAAHPSCALTIIGQDPPDDIVNLGREGIQVFSGVADLTPYYSRARVFVAPSRFAAGIPLKVIHAAAEGVPVVATPLLADQLRWIDGHELLVGPTAESFAAACILLHTDGLQWQRVRDAALDRIRSDYSTSQFMTALKGALSTAQAIGGRQLPLRHASAGEGHGPRDVLLHAPMSEAVST
jgi:glycosyltransferase involved in cell wall biosynthesis